MKDKILTWLAHGFLFSIGGTYLIVTFTISINYFAGIYGFWKVIFYTIAIIACVVAVILSAKKIIGQDDA